MEGEDGKTATPGLGWWDRGGVLALRRAIKASPHFMFGDNICGMARAKVVKIVCHSRRVLRIAVKYGWLPGARYTNLRDIRHFDEIGFIDIDWKHYSFKSHIEAVRATKPLMTVARDITRARDLTRTLDEAAELSCHANHVIVVPKDPALTDMLSTIARHFVLGYSVPSRYGGTQIAPSAFRGKVHLLGGRPDKQRRLANEMEVVSVDCNRFTFDAMYGDYFDGTGFRPHPTGGYVNCLRDSIRNITRLWQ